MYKADFDKAAAALNKSYRLALTKTNRLAADIVLDNAHDLADIFKTINPNFDRRRFMSAVKRTD